MKGIWIDGASIPKFLKKLWLESVERGPMRPAMHLAPAAIEAIRQPTPRLPKASPQARVSALPPARSNTAPKTSGATKPAPNPPNEITRHGRAARMRRSGLLQPGGQRSGIGKVLVNRPDAKALIVGSGGLRKMRWAKQGRGKRGGIKVICD